MSGRRNAWNKVVQTGEKRIPDIQRSFEGVFGSSRIRAQKHVSSDIELRTAKVTSTLKFEI
jgi:hypothetical protein